MLVFVLRSLCALFQGLRFNVDDPVTELRYASGVLADSIENPPKTSTQFKSLLVLPEELGSLAGG